jgi:hypothetical protein
MSGGGKEIRYTEKNITKKPVLKRLLKIQNFRFTTRERNPVPIGAEWAPGPV